MQITEWYFDNPENPFQFVILLHDISWSRSVASTYTNTPVRSDEIWKFLLLFSKLKVFLPLSSDD